MEIFPKRASSKAGGGSGIRGLISFLRSDLNNLIKMHAVTSTGVKAMRSVATRSISRAMSKAPNAGGCPRIAPIPRNMAEETKKIEEWWATSRTSAPQPCDALTSFS